jgi:hypothetical protein
MTSQPNGNASARPFALAITNLVKLGGLVLALYEVLFRSEDPHFSLVLAIAALMITGGQGLGAFLEKLFGAPGK